MKALLTCFLITIAFQVFSQENAAQDYDNPRDFKVGDNILLNEPSNGDNYRSVYYTYEAAKNIRPDLKAYSKEKIYLSNQFRNAPFTIVEIRGNEGVLAYGIMKNFAIIDLEMAIRSGEAGNRENMAPIWLAQELDKGDYIQLRSPRGAEFRSAYFTPKFTRKHLGLKTTENIYLPSSYQGDIFTITNKWDELALLGNDLSKEVAFIDLKSAVENEEIELRENAFISKEELLSQIDSTDMDLQPMDSSLYVAAVDTVERVALLDRIGIGLYVAPMIELAPKESSSLNYGGAIGVIIHNTWQVGAFIQGYGGSFSERIIFPNTFALDYSYAGLFAAYPLFQKDALSILAEVKLGAGEAAWSMEESSEVLDTDDFFVINPRIGLDYRLGRVGIVNVAVGYRLAQGLSMTELSSSELNSFNISAMLKIGWFNKPKVEEEEDD